MNNNLNDGGPAFPGEGGMSLRDYFAAAALTGIRSKSDADDCLSRDRAAYNAYIQADAMIAARESGVQGLNVAMLDALEYIACNPGAWVKHELPNGKTAYEWTDDENFLDVARAAISAARDQFQTL